MQKIGAKTYQCTHAWLKTDEFTLQLNTGQIVNWNKFDLSQKKKKSELNETYIVNVALEFKDHFWL